MKTSPKSLMFGFAFVAAAVGLILVGPARAQSVSQTKIRRPSSSVTSTAPPLTSAKEKIDKKNLVVPTPLEALASRVDELEAKLNFRIKTLEAKLDQLRAEHEELKGVVNRHDWDLYKPGGQIGLKRKVMQKNFWDRIPGDAYLVYYQR